jgi:hypothetical protein
MDSLNILTLAASIIGLSLPQGGEKSWCQPVVTKSYVLQELKDVRIEHVTDDKIDAAVGILSRQSVVPLTSRRYRQLVQKGPPPSRSRSRFRYLVRAGFMASEPAGIQLLKEGREPSYAVFQDDDDGHVIIVSLLTSYGRVQVPTGYPIVLTSPRPIKRVTVRCMGGA